MQYLLLFHCNNGCTNAPQWYIIRIRTLSLCVCVCVCVCVLHTYVYTRHRTAETQQTSSVVGKASRLRTGWSKARIPLEARIFPLLRNVQTGSGAIQRVPEFFTGGKAAGA